MFQPGCLLFLGADLLCLMWYINIFSTVSQCTPNVDLFCGSGPSTYDYDARFPPGTEPDVIDLFRKADVDGSGAIDTKELQRILSLKFFNFSRRTVRLMLHLFADDTTISSRLESKAPLYIDLSNHTFLHVSCFHNSFKFTWSCGIAVGAVMKLVITA